MLTYSERLWIKQKGKCFYCLELMIQQHGAPNSATIDHYVPRSIARGLGFDNLVLACKKCNEQKGNSLPAEFAGQYPDKVIQEGSWELVPNRGWKWVGPKTNDFIGRQNESQWDR